MQIQVDGQQVELYDLHPAATLLEVLREHLGVRSPKDGCSPQGQCGCCTVWVDGLPRVACVTPAARVAGREVTTLAGLPAAVRDRWAEAFTATGASQCGFCTPGIVMRLEGARAKGVGPDDRRGIDTALAAHLCRCTGWQTIREAYACVVGPAPALGAGRDLVAAAQRAALEGGAPQVVGPRVALGEGGFAEDTAPRGTPVAVRTAAGGWARGEDLGAARRAAAAVPGRRSTVGLRWPLEPPEGAWDLTLATTWVEPAYLEPDAAWCDATGAEGHPLANGGAFGGKVDSPVLAAARELAGDGGAVRVVWSREDVVRLGPKRPPLAAGLRLDGTGVVRVARTAGIAAAIGAALPAVVVEEVDVPGPPTSVAVRAAGWAEAAVLAAVLAGLAGATDGAPAWAPSDGVEIVHPGGGRARVRVDAAADGVPEVVHVVVAPGAVLDEVVLRSYCIGAVHQGLGWVRHEGLAVDAEGEPQDLTIRSFGVLRAAAMPDVHVTVEAAAEGADGPARPVSDAVFAATAAASWLAAGLPARWPTDRR